MRYVVLPFMLRRTGKALTLLRTEPAQHHIRVAYGKRKEVINRGSSRHRFSIFRPIGELAHDRASVSSPDSTNLGLSYVVFIDAYFVKDSALTGSIPHNWEDHITHLGLNRYAVGIRTTFSS